MSSSNNKTKFENMAREIYKWCFNNGLWDDVIVYFNGKAWTSFSEWNGQNGNKIAEELYEYMNKNPLNYFEYANPNTLSMSFEGNLYDVMNYYSEYNTKRYSELEGIFEKYGYYFELGHAWNLALYEI